MFRELWRPDLAARPISEYDTRHRLTEVMQGEAMVANGHDGLRRRVERDIDSESPAEPNGVDVYRHFFDDEGWQVVEVHRGRDGGLADAEDDTLYYLTDAQLTRAAQVDAGGDAIGYVETCPID